MKPTAEAERRIRELAESLPRAKSVQAPRGGAGAAIKTVGGTLKRGVKVFAGIFGVLGVVLLGNTLSLGLVNRLFALEPRALLGMPGILLHPLLHASFSHLAMNSLGILTLGGVVFLRSERDFWRVTVFGALFGGAVTWLVARPHLHVGASGVVFAYLGYLLTTGWFDRKPGAILLSLGVAAVWGTALLGLSPLQQGVSWELHLFGLIGGVITAWWRRKRG